MSAGAAGAVLVVEDSAEIRELLTRLLAADGHRVACAADGPTGLAMARAAPFDMVLLDMGLPGMGGLEVLSHMREDEALRHLPVIIVSAAHDLEGVARSIELGAEDYLFKPINRVLLRARLAASLEKKRLRDQEQALLARVREEQARTERLLHSILPPPIARRLTAGEETIAELAPAATVLFADIVDFTFRASQVPARELVGLLTGLFGAFDALVERRGVEKVKAIGDGYLLASGVLEPRADHAAAMAEAALDMMAAASDYRLASGAGLQLRIGIHSGPVVAGVIGAARPRFDLWGETVNLASRMESTGVPGRIQVTAATRDLLASGFLLEPRGPVEIQGLGRQDTYFLVARREPGASEPPGSGRADAPWSTAP